MSTYYGNQSYTNDYSHSVSNGRFSANVTFSITGTSSQNFTLDSLELYCKVASGSASSIRPGIYLGSTKALIAEGSTHKVPGTAYAWVTWTAASSELTWHNDHTALIGGTAYMLGFSLIDSGADISTGGTPGTLGCEAYTAVSYATMPDPIPTGLTNSSVLMMWRFGVTEITSGLSIPLVMGIYGQQ